MFSNRRTFAASAYRYRRAMRLSHGQRRARSDARLATAMLLLSIFLAPLCALGVWALYPVALGETGASAARVADAYTICAMLTALALGALLWALFSLAMLFDAMRRF